MTVLPNFFVVGAPKAGTTSLYHYLRQHPDIYMSPIKEPGFFASELRPEHRPPAWRRQMARHAKALDAYLDNPVGRPPRGTVITEWPQYLKLFGQAREGQAIGEASAAYLWSQTAARGIAERAPDARIVMILRHPADRAFSQYLQRVSEDRPNLLPFGETIRSSAGTATTHASGPVAIAGGRDRRTARARELLEFGAYARQVERFLERFPRDRIGVYLYEDFSREPVETLRAIFCLLRVREDVPLNLTVRYMEPKVPRCPRLERHVVRRAAQVLPDGMPAALRRVVHRVRFLPRRRLAMSAEDRRFLIDFYADDIQRLSAVIGRDLSHWLRHGDDAGATSARRD